MRNWVSLSRFRIILFLCWSVLTKMDHSAALCQIFDSIYNDIPMARVKFNVNTEYAYLQNFKILQSKISQSFAHGNRF